MENTFNKVRDYILENGNSNFRKIDKSFSTKFKLETLNTMLLLEEKNDISKITMSFFYSFEISENDCFAFRIEKEQNGYKLIGGTFDEDNNDIEIEIIEKENVLKIFENEIENLILQ